MEMDENGSALAYVHSLVFTGLGRSGEIGMDYAEGDPP